ncbi:MAG: hypothetical protein PHV34_13610 [Verrucomicrobiae bacterium]|nr:hypothetical protein [Verrucomicrobiae bacterium]
MKMTAIIMTALCFAWGQTGAQSTDTNATATAGAAVKLPLTITLFQQANAANWFYTSKGRTSAVKLFKVQFKVLDDSLTEFEVARVYLYNDKKELIHTLAEPEGSENAKGMQGIPNIISMPKNLRKNTGYHLLFAYPGDQIKWKYAVAVLGTDQAVVADAIPHMSKAHDFEFKEKPLLVK